MRSMDQPLARARDLGVDRVEARVGALRQLARERFRAVEHVGQVAIGHVALVKREHGLFALVRAAHRSSVRGEEATLSAGDVLAGAGIDADDLALVDE